MATSTTNTNKLPDRVWVGRDAIGGLMIYWKCPEPGQAVEFMRVLSRKEVEKLASDAEGVDTQQLINSLHRTIDGQRRHIATLEATCQRYADAMEDDGK